MPDVPTPARLRERLRYEAESGRFWWLAAPDLPKEWNTRFSGREAFTCTTRLGYRQGSVDGKMLTAHRVAWAIVHGEWPTAEVDHINGDRGDNRLANLRDVPHAENQRNMCRHASNSSGAVGVSWHKRDKRFRAYVEVNGVHLHLGYFATFDEAKAARAAASVKLGFHNGHGKEAA